MSKYCPIADAVTNCTENCDACLREEYEMDTDDIVAYLKHLCEDFKNQGEHFEFVAEDAKIISKAIQKLEEIKCQNTQNLKPNTKPRWTHFHSDSHLATNSSTK